MPRVARQLIDGQIYHLLNRGNGRQRIFHKDRDYQAFTELFFAASERHKVDLLAWCLMPNHYHLVVRPQMGVELSRGMQWLQTTHARRYHRHYGSSGHLWQGRYKSFAVEDNEQLVTVIRYVEANPVRAGMVTTAMAWNWSSHQLRVEGKGTGSAGACPPPAPLAPPPMELPQPWTVYVDTPMTDRELAKARMKKTGLKGTVPQCRDCPSPKIGY